MARIEDAIVDFIIHNGTFYASLISQMTRVVDYKVDTMSTTITNGRILLKYNPKYTEPLNMKDTKTALEHECMHIVMEHGQRAKGRDQKKWNIACDLAINQLLSHIPADYITPERLFGQDMYKYKIQNNQNAEYYYELLEMSDGAKKKMEGDGECGCGNEMGSGDGSASGDGELQKEIIKQAVGEAVKSAKGQGHLPAGLEQYIEELFKPTKVSWRTLLRKFVACSVKSGSKSSWKRPSRRYGVTQKGRIADRTVALTLVIDTSGSIDDGMLQTFMDEVTSIQKCYKATITVLECDAAVAREYKLKKFEKLRRDVHGRGGTSFKPPFKYIKEKNIRTDALIYFTDLCGDFPDKKPNIPILWAYYNCGWGDQTSNVPFGTVVTLEREKEKRQ